MDLVRDIARNLNEGGVVVIAFLLLNTTAT